MSLERILSLQENRLQGGILPIYSKIYVVVTGSHLGRLSGFCFPVFLNDEPWWYSPRAVVVLSEGM
jgi:hypothetical protein